MIVGIDARGCLARGRGWGRYAEGFIGALAVHAPELELRVLMPRTVDAQRLIRRLPRGLFVRQVDLELPTAGDYMMAALEAAAPEDSLGDVDVLHVLNRFVPPTSLRPVVATVHDVAPLSPLGYKGELRRSTERALERLGEYNAGIVAVSEFTRQELNCALEVDAERTRVIYQGVDESLSTAGRAAGGGERHNEDAMPCQLLYVGGAGPNKNLDRLLEALRHLRITRDIRLVMVGSRLWGYDDLFARLYGGREALPAWVEFRDWVDDAALVALYRESAALLFPSLHEGFGLPVLEAMTQGTPICCSGIPVLRDLAEDVPCYFDPLNLADIVSTVDALLGDATLRRRCRRRGLERSRRFTWRRAVGETVEFYRVLGVRPGIG